MNEEAATTNSARALAIAGQRPSETPGWANSSASPYVELLNVGRRLSHSPPSSYRRQIPRSRPRPHRRSRRRRFPRRRCQQCSPRPIVSRSESLPPARSHHVRSLSSPLSVRHPCRPTHGTNHPPRTPPRRRCPAGDPRSFPPVATDRRRPLLIEIPHLPAGRGPTPRRPHRPRRSMHSTKTSPAP